MKGNKLNCKFCRWAEPTNHKDFSYCQILTKTVLHNGSVCVDFEIDPTNEK